MPARRHPAASRGAWTTPRRPGPPLPPPPKPPRFNTVKTLWAIAIAISGAISGFVGFVVVIDRGRQERLAAIESHIHDLYKASDATRSSAFADLETADLAEHLEPTALRGLQLFIQDQTAAAPSACASATPEPSVLSREHVSRAFRLIATFQAPSHTRHSYPDRVIDAFLVWWHGKPPVVPGPFTLDGKDLRGVSLRNVNLRLASFVNACLAGADFDSTVLDSARFDSAVLDGARFVHAVMRSSSLVGVHADDIMFDHSDLTDANLSGARLSRARFFDANLSCATLGNAVLDDAYFSTATVRWAFLGGAQLARLRQWDEVRAFTGAYVGGARGLLVREASLAHDSGAVADTTNARRWSEERTRQLEAGGLCARVR